MQKNINLNTATYVGIDCHPTEHTALAMNRFEDEKGILRFENTGDGITQFLSWLISMDRYEENIILGVEGGGNSRHALVANILRKHHNLYEVNPLYTKQRRSFGTRSDKSDPRDAKLIAEVLTRKLTELPKITEHDLSSWMLVFRIETFFSDQKSRGFHIHKSHISDVQRLSRLLIASCLAYIWIVYLGSVCEKDQWRPIIHRRKRCDLSLFQLGLRLLEYFLNEEMPIPVQFHVII